MDKYDPGTIEPKWQKVWEEKDLYRALDFSSKPKFYLLVEFPYCSGTGLHIGHARAWLPTDALARKRRMGGYNVLFPMGWDAFGLPTENYAIKTGRSPAEITAENIAHFGDQAKSLGLSFDWSREVDTSDPKYYKWTQWIFVQLFKKGLAYQDKVPVNWCPACKTNLADEEVLPNGYHERCGKPTEKRLQKQWLLRITKYADRLVDDLQKVDYPEQVAAQQINWIGRKEGINITYDIVDSNEKVTVFTTRPDTNFGATFIVLAPEHPLVAKIVADEYKEKMTEYVARTKEQTEADRIADGRKKTGVFTGRYAVNRLTGKKMPIWVSDFVLMSFGTGAVVGVPGHDVRDFEFAKEFGLEIIRVVVGADGDRSQIKGVSQVQEKEGVMINSDFLDGLKINNATIKIMDYLEKQGWGRRTTTYHLHDWVFSRQHYWGEPIPIIHCPKCGPVAVPESELPVELPYLKKYEPSGTGESPLAKVADWVETTCPQCGGKAKRETDTMPNWAGSNWYYVRYLDPHNDKEMASRRLIAYWLPVDVYEGGYEHTTLHLLYSRFIYKFLFDIGVVPNDEPYAARRVHGILLASDNRKMSKSLGNVIDPMEVVKKYGSDTLRLYEMFIGPFDQQVLWDDRSLAGCYRLCCRIYNLAGSVGHSSSLELKNKLAKTVRKVSADLEGMKFNTAVAALMEFVNVWERSDGLGKDDLETFLKILAPFAPHLAEELWARRGHEDSVHLQSWPKVGQMVVEEVTEIPVMVNGKLRAMVKNSGDVEKLAAQDLKVKKYVAGKKIKKTVYVPGKVINFVV